MSAFSAGNTYAEPDGTLSKQEPSDFFQFHFDRQQATFATSSPAQNQTKPARPEKLDQTESSSQSTESEETPSGKFQITMDLGHSLDVSFTPAAAKHFFDIMGTFMASLEDRNEDSTIQVTISCRSEGNAAVVEPAKLTVLDVHRKKRHGQEIRRLEMRHEEELRKLLKKQDNGD